MGGGRYRLSYWSSIERGLSTNRLIDHWDSAPSNVNTGVLTKAIRSEKGPYAHVEANRANTTRSRIRLSGPARSSKKKKISAMAAY